MSIVVVATFVPLPEHRAEVLAIFEDVVPRVHSGDVGCELYALHEGADRFVLIEKWSSEETMQTRARGDLVRELIDRLGVKLAAPFDVQVMRPLPLGTLVQGSL